ncbi:MAG: 3'-5' exonuclease [Chitinophagaceae bacterium]|nr:MAG: 3'-5' exonuclease [Chitinophagaceae bacterium]
MQYPLNNILFLDIETVPQYASYGEVPNEWKKLWDHKAAQLIRGKEEETESSVYPTAGIYAEFGRIICISCGVMQGSGPLRKILIKSFRGHDEKSLLHDFADMLLKWSVPEPKYLCAHNGKNFDFPYLCRRMLILGVTIPPILNSAGKKPWEVSHIDTLELWKFGEYKNFTSLNLLAHALNVPTPKDDIDGSMVWQVYWIEKNLERIVTYCQKDVVTVAQVLLRMQGEQLIGQERIEIK